MDGVHVEINFGGEPFVILLAEEGGDEAQKGGLVGEKSGDAGAAFEFLIDAPDGVAGAHAPLRGGGEDVNGETFREVLLYPSGEFWGGFGLRGNALLEPCLGGKKIRRVEDGADLFGHIMAHLEARDVGSSVLLQMELAALPGHRGKDGLAGGGHARMGIADDEAGDGMVAACHLTTAIDDSAGNSISQPN